VSSRAWCRSCSAEIVWCWTRNRQRIPVNVDPVPDGNIQPADGYTLTEGATIIVDPVPSLFDSPTALRYVSHFASCPHADAWRREGLPVGTARK
jgi:hypothetical protein